MADATASIHDLPTFTVIGENIHCTRVVKRGGVRGHIFDDGTEAVKYRRDGVTQFVRVPEHFTSTQPWEQGNLKHFMIAIWCGNHGDSEQAAEGQAYIDYEIDRQTRAGAHYLDLNVDEISHRLPEQVEAMRWLVGYFQSVSTLPPCIDSSNTDIIRAGLEAYDGSIGRPMVNSVALERLDALDLVVAHDAKCIVSAASESGMPENAQQRIDNASKVVEAATAKGVAMDDLYIDPLFFPVSVDPAYGPHAFEAIAGLRERFGDAIHITGGMSNVSFGLPKRALLNIVFVKLAIEAGADSGIVDPVHVRVDRLMNVDMESSAVQAAVELLQGRDEYAMNYITAYRAGELN